jgi:hypothetical protein
VWVRDDESDDALPPECDVQQVSYSLATEENEDGETVVTGLQRSARKYLSGIALEDGEEDPAVESDLMTPEIRFLHLRYYGGTEWADAWGRGVPMGVEITVGATQRPDDMDVEDYLEQYETSQRVVNIPGARASRGSGG